MRILIVGTGVVARVLATTWQEAGLIVVQCSSRTSLPRAEPYDAVMICVSDRAIAEVAQRVVDEGAANENTVLLHGAGAVPPTEAFSAVRGRVAGVALCHPLLAIADEQVACLAGATFAVAGDAVGLAVAKHLAECAQGRVVVLDEQGLDRYHAAAVLVANHTLALLAAGMELLTSIGIPPNEASSALGKLLESSVDNWIRLGLPAALTGPIARGDAHIVVKHITGLPPSMHDLYRVTGQVLIDLARAKGQASEHALEQIEVLLATSPKKHEG